MNFFKNSENRDDEQQKLRSHLRLYDRIQFVHIFIEDKGTEKAALLTTLIRISNYNSDRLDEKITALKTFRD